MKCTLNVDVTIVKGSEGIAYKYVIRSQNRKGAHPYEILHETPRKYPKVNRCLSVPGTFCHPDGMLIVINSPMEKSRYNCHKLLQPLLHNLACYNLTL